MKRTGRDRKANQTRRARELVQSGAVLTRNKIGELSKATARAYLSSMDATVRGNVEELKSRLRLIFDANGIDAFRNRDDLISVTDPKASGRSVSFHIPKIPSVEAPDTID